MTAGYASLCFLSYNRPEFIEEAVRSAVVHAEYPVEVIVHDDGSSDPRCQQVLLRLLAEGSISHLIFNSTGHNEGVGTAINRCFKIATGDYLLKLDQDLLFNPGWLARIVELLEADPAVGCAGLFRYEHDPVDYRKMQIEWGTPEAERDRWRVLDPIVKEAVEGPAQGVVPYHFVRDFVGSALVFPREIYEKFGPLDEHSDAFAEDVMYKQRLKEGGFYLALPDVDLAYNRGFGPGPSTVVALDDSGQVKVSSIHHGPHVIGRKKVGEPAEDRKFDVAVVITTTTGREANVERLLRCLNNQENLAYLKGVCIVCDGCPHEHYPPTMSQLGIIEYVEIPKHHPGQEQPRNVGFRRAVEKWPDINYVWFLDSDLIFDKDCLSHLYAGLCAAPQDRILMAPYDWLSPGQTEPLYSLKNDIRWEMFERNGPEVVFGPARTEEEKRAVLGPALGNLGGNLVWPVEEFKRVGGFHPELHHGRCEDGELGLRAASNGVPMSCVRDARAWHVDHPRDNNWAVAANERDVPMLNAWHPWVQGAGLVLNTEEDGCRFDFRCPQCGEQVNSALYWNHMATH